MSILDRLPQSMRRYLIGNIVLVIAGGGLIVGPILLYSLSGEPLRSSLSPLSSIGSAVLASGFVGFVYYFYMRTENRYEQVIELVDRWGLIDIHQERGRGKTELYTQKLRSCEEQLDIQALSLRRFFTDCGDIVENLGQQGVQIRLLLMDPESDHCDWIEENNPEYDDLEERIQNSVEDYLSLDTDNIEIKLYDAPPLSYFRIDNEAFVGPYFPEKASRVTVTFLGRVDGDMVDQYRENFEAYWSNHSRSVSS